jgi:PAS domain-containing protein
MERSLETVGSTSPVAAAMSHPTGIDAESILEESPDGVVVVDETWRVRYANRAVEGIAGRARTEIVGEEIWKVLPTLTGTPARPRSSTATPPQIAIT